MKFVIAAALISSAAAFQAPATQKVSTVERYAVPFNKPAAALPYLGDKGAPATLDGTLPGDFGLDPVGFSTAPFAKFFDSKSKDSMSDLYWLREAEITHGRIAQLAVLGFIAPSLFGTFPGNDWSGIDAYSFTNPVEAIDHVPGFAVAQIVAGMSWVELKRVELIGQQGSKRIPGDLNLGQGGYNPFNLKYSQDQYADKQLQEIKHCRLAMLGATGLWFQATNSGTDVVSQLAGAFAAPEYAAKAGYFNPEGI
jgi:hypothetical protein